MSSSSDSGSSGGSGRQPSASETRRQQSQLQSAASRRATDRAKAEAERERAERSERREMERAAEEARKQRAAEEQRMRQQQLGTKREEQILETEVAKSKPAAAPKTPARVDTTTLAGIRDASTSAAPDTDIERRQMLQLGTEDAPRRVAIKQLTERLETDPLANIPSTAGVVLGAVSKANLKNQINVLRDFGTPVFEAGTDKAVGVVSKTGQYSGDPLFQEAALKSKGDGQITLNQKTLLAEEAARERDEPQAPLVSPEVEEEEAAPTILAEGPTTRKRGTRFKRFGGAGTILEGTGALYD